MDFYSYVAIPGPAGLSTGTAGGDLTGNYPNPTIAAGAVTAAKISPGTITDTQLSSANKSTAFDAAGAAAVAASSALAAAEAYTDSKDPAQLADPVIGTGAGQTEFKGGAWFSCRRYTNAGGATLTGLISDYLIAVTDTSAARTYQAVAMGSTATKRAPIIIKDESYASAFGVALAHPITFRPPSGKKLNNVVDATLVILNGGGVISVEEDESGNWHQLGYTP
jgi:hypothetical protein